MTSNTKYMVANVKATTKIKIIEEIVSCYEALPPISGGARNFFSGIIQPCMIKSMNTLLMFLYKNLLLRD